LFDFRGFNAKLQLLHACKFVAAVTARRGSIERRLLFVAERSHRNVTRQNVTDDPRFAKYVVVKRVDNVGSGIRVRRGLIIWKTTDAMNAKPRRFVDVDCPTLTALLLLSVDRFQETFEVRHQVKAKRETVRPKPQFARFRIVGVGKYCLLRFMDEATTRVIVQNSFAAENLQTRETDVSFVVDVIAVRYQSR